MKDASKRTVTKAALKSLKISLGKREYFHADSFKTKEAIEKEKEKKMGIHKHVWH